MRVTGKLCEDGQYSVVTVADNRIVSVEPHDANQPVELGGPDVWIAPGFIDTQFNGYGGYNFNRGSWSKGDASDAAIPRIVELAARAGTAMICPTIFTGHNEGMMDSLRSTARAVAEDRNIAKALPAIHVEGPYISSEEGARGAHPPECIRDPDWDEFQRFQEAANGLIKILTLAPERNGALAFIEKATAAGIVISIGHTASTPQQIRDAVDAGACMSTHLGNGSHAMIPRHQNYIWEQLADDRITAGIITDGHHLPPSVAKCFARVKGPERLVIVSDAVSLGGCPPGIYDDGRHEVLPSGKVVLAGTPYLAGAGHLLDTCVANALRFTDLGLDGIARATATNPAQLLGLGDRKGRVAAGYDADLTLFRVPQDEAPLDIVATLVEGRTVFRA